MPEIAERDYRTTVDEFRAFIEDRPDDEKWELVDGEILLNPTPTNRHQIIVHNLEVALELERRRVGGSWQVHAGIGTRHPSDPLNESVPDLMIVPKALEVTSWTYEALALFEVLSPFSVRRDMVRKRGFYSTLDTLTHYVFLAQDRQVATVFAREQDFSPTPVRGPDARIEIAPLGISVALADAYRDVLFD